MVPELTVALLFTNPIFSFFSLFIFLFLLLLLLLLLLFLSIDEDGNAVWAVTVKAIHTIDCVNEPYDRPACVRRAIDDI